ncbi:MAG: 2-phospho-L-lactate guanylyltransferase [Solirubrobacteraceae bacterium]
METLAILPVKRFALAKQRLSERLRPEDRRALAEAMVTDVLAVLVVAKRLNGVLVVTNEPAVAAVAQRLGAEVTPDRAEAGQSAAASIGVAEALRRGVARVLLVPGDCPALDGDELDELLAHDASGARVVIVPDRHGQGTNALLLSPPDVIEPAFGPGSFERHSSLAASAGAECVVARPPTLLLDIDTPADLAALLAGPQHRATRTRAAYAAALSGP